eukprot:scaffold306_cov525-Prasinococcus_capsulatus_cf.AAC.33
MARLYVHGCLQEHSHMLEELSRAYSVLVSCMPGRIARSYPRTKEPCRASLQEGAIHVEQELTEERSGQQNVGMP